jgi:hypothetical protein
MNSGSVLSFHVSVRCGLRPDARQIRETAVWFSPVSAAIVRVDQCVSWPRPFCVSVLVITTSTCSSVILRGAPGRGASARPSSRLSRNRDRHLRVISRDTPNRAATAVTGSVPAFSAQASTILARSASAWDVFRLRASASSAPLSSSVSTSGPASGSA